MGEEERKEQQRRESEGKPGKKAIRAPWERKTCPRRELLSAAQVSLRCR
jgi:hypothetical protein